MAEIITTMTSPPADAVLERLWESFREAHIRAQETDSTLEDGLEAGRRYRPFMEACVDHEGEI